MTKKQAVIRWCQLQGLICSPKLVVAHIPSGWCTAWESWQEAYDYILKLQRGKVRDIPYPWE